MLNRFIARSLLSMLGVFLVITLASCISLQSSSSARALSEEFSPEVAARVGIWLELKDGLRKQKALSEWDKLERVNTFVNHLAWRSDMDNWGVEDYWATPLETVARGMGDCEDLAIAKYFTLLDAGISEKRLRLNYVWHWDEGVREAHVVLAYYAGPESEVWILDNLEARVLSLAGRADLEPVYSFDRWNLWLADSAGQSLAVASQDRLDHWRQVNERMQGDNRQHMAAL